MSDEEYKKYCESCQDLIKVRDFKAVLEKIEKDFANNTDDPDYLAMKGYALGELGEIEEALTTLNRALQLDNSFAHVHNNLAWIYIKMKRWEDALNHFDNVWKIAPEYHPNFLRSDILFRLGREEEANQWLRMDIEQYEEWLNENPDASVEEKENAYFWLLNGLHQVGEYEQELTHQDKMCEIVWGEVPSHLVDYREELVQLIEEKNKPQNTT